MQRYSARCAGLCVCPGQFHRCRSCCKKRFISLPKRYSDSRGQTDLVTSWSVAKSFTSALLGVAVERSEIDGMDQRLEPITFLVGPARKKAAITVRDLMTVRTALDLIGDPDKDGVPDGADLYGANDQLTVSLDRPLVWYPRGKSFIPIPMLTS